MPTLPSALVAIAVIAVAAALLLGFLNLARPGAGERSQKLMRWRVGLQLFGGGGDRHRAGDAHALGRRGWSGSIASTPAPATTARPASATVRAAPSTTRGSKRSARSTRPIARSAWRGWRRRVPAIPRWRRSKRRWRARRTISSTSAPISARRQRRAKRTRALRIAPSQVERLEREIDALNADLAPLRSFVLPGGTRAAAALHQARVVCRRAERRMTALAASRAGRRDRARLRQPPVRLSVRRRARRQRAWSRRRAVGPRREPGRS